MIRLPLRAAAGLVTWMGWHILWGALVVSIASRSGHSGTVACPGDCNHDGTVTVDEIIIGVGIALDALELEQCAAFEQTPDGMITVDELLAAVAALLGGCSATPTASPTVTPTEAAPPVPTATPTSTAEPGSGAVFTDVTLAANVDYIQFHIPSPALFTEPEYFSGGAAAGDYDNDGWVDLFVTRIDAPSILFRNTGDGRFENTTAASGLQDFNLRANGAGWADVDNDGDADLYVTTLADMRYYLFINDGMGHFTEEARARGAAIEGRDPHYGFSPAFGDYDRDGYLDLFVGEWRYEEYDPTGSRSNARLLRNRGALAPGFFDDATDAAGVAIDGIPSMGPRMGAFPFTPRFADLDDDGWPDLVITADFGTSRLFWNDGDGTFTDGTVAAQVGGDEDGMGSAIGDYDGDGRLDWFVTSIFDPDKFCSSPSFDCYWGNTGNRLYRNEGGRRFSDHTDVAGVRDGYWGWGAAFFDYDNDADLDIIMTNGVDFAFVPPDVIVLDRFRRDPMRLWRNHHGVMSEVSAAAGIASTEPGKGLLTFDYDRDGDVDVFVANNGGHPVLYRNEGTRGGWLRVKVVGRDSNRDAIGARVVITPWLGGPSQLREIDAGSHYLGQSELTAHFGLGAGLDAVALVRVEWPATRRVVELTNVSRNTTLVVTELAAGTARSETASTERRAPLDACAVDGTR